jgi:hypothetical protein
MPMTTSMIGSQSYGEAIGIRGVHSEPVYAHGLVGCSLYRWRAPLDTEARVSELPT